VIKELNEFNYHQTISEMPGISLVFFSGPHCGSCHHLRDLLIAHYQEFVAHFKQFHVFEVKADKAGALVNEFNVFHLPTIFLYKEGEFHCELQAIAQPKSIIKAIEYALKQPAQEEP